MKKKEQKTRHTRPSEIKENWIVLDAKDQVLGRLASFAASRVKGKHSVQYTPSVDTGDYVVIINTDHIAVTGQKETQKNYYSHSGYPGGLKTISYADQMKKDSTQVVYRAVKGMLPHNSLGRQLLKKVKLYAGSEHPHEAQNPEVVDIQ
ncbi:50S ribosomal protein L13 [Candidatus Marinamargulisbacteria bacterium SCGC AG-439-L15]|nr:50S ribosomal protein L13 [Candidatus Marinamargulisbacteria bacterium SCGC AG-439-L15]